MRRQLAPPAGAIASSRSGPGDDHWRHVNVGRLLSNALRHFEGRVIALLEQAGHDEITVHHIHATRHLDLEGSRLVDMARRAAVTKQSMSELVAQLEELGIVARRPDPTDGRARIVYFTPKGLAWLDDFRRAVQQAENEMASQVGPDSLRAVKEGLRVYGPAVD